MLITDRHTSLFLSSLPSLARRPIVWQAGGAYSLVLSHRLAWLPADSSWNNPSLVSLHAGLAWDRRVDLTTRSREETFLLPSFDLPFALPLQIQHTRFHDVSAPRPPPIYYYHHQYTDILSHVTGCPPLRNRPSIICTTRSTNLNAFRASYAVNSLNEENKEDFRKVLYCSIKVYILEENYWKILDNSQ